MSCHVMSRDKLKVPPSLYSTTTLHHHADRDFRDLSVIMSGVHFTTTYCIHFVRNAFFRGHRTLSLFFAETESLRKLLEGREAEATALREKARKDREELVSRLLKDKERYGLEFISATVFIEKGEGGKE